MPKRFACGAPAIWQNDFSFEDYGMDGEGIVSVWMCSVCESMHEVYIDLDKEDDNFDRSCP